jgi:outer membrane protein OmpA-like peptidoglycan-associated protein
MTFPRMFESLHAPARKAFLLLATVLLLSADHKAGAQAVRTLDVFFPPGYLELTENARDSINDFFISLGWQRLSSVRISGYCDEERVPLFNLTLSERRAKAVYDYIESTGKARSEIMSYKGYGKTGAKSRNHTELQITFAPRDSVTKQEVKRRKAGNINKDSLLAGKSVRLNLNFYPGESNLLPVAKPFLTELETFLLENPEIRIEIHGHVCCSNNMSLSVDRAAEVYEQLVKRGIQPSRLFYKGFGNSRPLVHDEYTEEDRERNRRVEIRLKKD